MLNNPSQRTLSSDNSLALRMVSRQWAGLRNGKMPSMTNTNANATKNSCHISIWFYFVPIIMNSIVKYLYGHFNLFESIANVTSIYHFINLKNPKYFNSNSANKRRNPGTKLIISPLLFWNSCKLLQCSMKWTTMSDNIGAVQKINFAELQQISRRATHFDQKWFDKLILVYYYILIFLLTYKGAYHGKHN